jgi:signal peptidase II
MKQKYLILFSLSGFILSCDQLTKHLVHSKLAPGVRHWLIPGLMSLSHTRNAGFAFGLLEKVPQSLQEVFFIGIPVFALILIVLIFIKLQDNQMLTSLALTSILGGATGNLLDRIQYGYVIDFLDFHLGSSIKLPAFNIADFAIIAGVALMFYNTLRQERPEAA